MTWRMRDFLTPLEQEPFRHGHLVDSVFQEDGEIEDRIAIISNSIRWTHVLRHAIAKDHGNFDLPESLKDAARLAYREGLLDRKERDELVELHHDANDMKHQWPDVVNFGMPEVNENVWAAIVPAINIQTPNWTGRGSSHNAVYARHISKSITQNFFVGSTGELEPKYERF